MLTACVGCALPEPATSLHAGRHKYSSTLRIKLDNRPDKVPPCPQDVPHDAEEHDGPKHQDAVVHGRRGRIADRGPENPEDGEDKVRAGEAVVDGPEGLRHAPGPPVEVGRTRHGGLVVARLDRACDAPVEEEADCDEIRRVETRDAERKHVVERNRRSKTDER